MRNNSLLTTSKLCFGAAVPLEEIPIRETVQASRHPGTGTRDPHAESGQVPAAPPVPGVFGREDLGKGGCWGGEGGLPGPRVRLRAHVRLPLLAGSTSDGAPVGSRPPVREARGVGARPSQAGVPSRLHR